MVADSETARGGGDAPPFTAVAHQHTRAHAYGSNVLFK